MKSQITTSVFNIQIQVLKAQFTQNNINISHSYSLTLSHKLVQFQTAIYPVLNNKIDLSSTRPFSILCPFLNQNNKNKSEPFLKIVYNSSDSKPKFQSFVEEQSISTIVNQHFNKINKNRHKVKFILSYPIFFRGRNVLGEIHLKFSCSKARQQNQMVQSSRFSSNNSKISIINERKKIFSNSDEIYFNPVVSKAIYVTTQQQEIQDEESKLTIFKQQKNLHENLETQTIFKRNQWEAINSDISSINQKDSKICLSARDSLDEEIKQFGPYSNIQTPYWNKDPSQSNLKEQSENLEDIPEDYRHLFQKICQINKKYAPLERIPSQQELSEEMNLSQNKSLNESFYSLQSDPTDARQQDRDPLAIAEELLKELNIYKFGQSLNIKGDKESG